MLKVFIFLCTTLIVVNAYDFSDTYFNQFLFNEYNMLNAHAAETSRQRRDVYEVTADELAKELKDSLPAVASVTDKEHDSKNTLLVLETHNPKEIDAIVEEAHDIPSSSTNSAGEDSILTPPDHDHVVEEHEESSTSTLATTTAADVHKTTPPVHKPVTTTVRVQASVQVSSPEDGGGSSQCAKNANEMKNDLTCCDANRHDPVYFAMIRGTKKQCAKKLRTNNPVVENFDPFKCEDVDKIKQLIICESECVAKTLNMLDEHGVIRRDAIIDNFKKRLVGLEESKIKSFESYVDKCLNKMKHIDVKVAHGKCSTVPMEFQHCMFGEMVIGCPVEHQIKSARCQKIRDRYSSGESLALGRTSILDFVHQAKRHDVYGKV